MEHQRTDSNFAPADVVGGVKNRRSDMLKGVRTRKGEWRCLKWVQGKIGGFDKDAKWKE